ncbi:hypothetical protein RD110_18805 [Rhodoferax koreense]|uniref:Uncharacterized protein n=1 Tax=Rhodoferax koreensis TaxID=1842727 RepID=A0A1P8JZ40_9BURK|nr:hypothetical protein [Rhodoferax koreense]APW39005.1 hypothetical protein RD110_18805 [Rhodoferax koreense]
MTTPENIREGDPYDDPAFEALAREHDVWGRASGAQCAVFWRAGKEAQARDIEAQRADAFALRALVAAGHISQALVDRARALPGAPIAEADRIKTRYGKWTAHHGIHSNRFPAWDEMSEADRADWLRRHPEAGG